MQLLRFSDKAAHSCSQVHKPVNFYKSSFWAYELANNSHSLIHKFISQEIEARSYFQAYKLMNNFAWKKNMKFFLLNGITSYFAQSLTNRSEWLKVTFLFCANRVTFLFCVDSS